MEDLFELNIIVPLVPVYVPENHLSEYIDSAIKDILTLNGKIEINIENIGRFSLNVFSFTDEPFIEKAFPNTGDVVLVFRIVIPNTSNEIEISTTDDKIITPEERLSLFKHSIVHEFKFQVINLLVLSNIARPGGIKTRDGIVSLNRERFESFPSIYSIHRESLDDIKALKWPVYKSLDLLSVWQWIERNNFSFQSHSKTKVDRALNAFTYLFKDSPENMVFDLFWSLIGVEALYCSSKDGISEQIYEKVQLVLGPVTESKKKVKSMYNFRSRLVHGDIDIPPNHFDYWDTDEEKFQDELFDATILAVAILTATLQEIVFKNETSLNFKYILE
jgi:hypothetical protein